MRVSRHVRAAEQGRPAQIGELEPANRAVLDTMLRTVDRSARDWRRFHQQAIDFHLRNAEAWANEATGEDLADQIDPGFVLDPMSLAGSNR
jgi:CO dehydrogenase maturation factor